MTLVVYWIGGWRHRNWLLFGVSFVFYTSGGGNLVLLLFGTSIATYLLAIAIVNKRFAKSKNALSLIGISLLVGSLTFWKYLGFLVFQISSLLSGWGFGAKVHIDLVLPIAISFYTFQCISYLVDVRRGTIPAERDLGVFLCYIFFFPHLLAGPVVRFSDVVEELSTRPQRLLFSFSSSSPRFFWGLAKKVLIADQAGQVADVVFSVAGYQLTALDTVVGVLAYAIQIYFDFSGYSDMAIGLAGMFGITFQENFRRPYSAISVTDFWRRWHISLSSWFRDYVYIPLGGNRRGVAKTFRNLLIVFVLTGFWHGANWTFLAWGGLHGSALILERLILRQRDSFRVIVRFGLRSWTLLVIFLGWLIFRAVDMRHALELLSALDGGSGFLPSEYVSASLTTQRLIWMSIGAIVFFVSSERSIGQRLGDPASGALWRLCAVGVGGLAAMYALSSSFTPFLYFQF